MTKGRTARAMFTTSVGWVVGCVSVLSLAESGFLAREGELPYKNYGGARRTF